MIDIVKRDFDEAGLNYDFELEDGIKLHMNDLTKEGYLLREEDGDVLYVPVANTHPVDNYGESDYYDVIGFEKKHMK